MQLKRLLVVAACVLALAGMSFADSLNDPKIIVGGGGNTPILDQITITGNTFSVFSSTGTTPPCTVNGQSDPTCEVTNGNNYTWTTLSFLISPTQGNLSCDGGFFFAGCSVNNDLGIVSFFACNGQFCDSGITPGGTFIFEAQGFLPNTGFGGTANSVPEPASLVLLLTGAGALFVRRRRQ